MNKVLAVDDSTSMRQMLAHTLRAGGYDVLEAVDGVDALERLAGASVDAVITDQNMPRLDGVALTRALRADERWRTLPVLILTTESDESLRQAGRAAGATGWLRKPFEPATLLQVLGRVLPAKAGS
jgi:two-component system chemotaxis response regulator CheY